MPGVPPVWVGLRAGAVGVEGLDTASAWRGPLQSLGYVTAKQVLGLQLECLEPCGDWSV